MLVARKPRVLLGDHAPSPHPGLRPEVAVDALLESVARGRGSELAVRVRGIIHYESTRRVFTKS